MAAAAIIAARRRLQAEHDRDIFKTEKAELRFPEMLQALGERSKSGWVRKGDEAPMTYAEIRARRLSETRSVDGEETNVRISLAM